MYVGRARKRKVRKTVYFQFSKFQKGHNFHKNWRKYSKTKSYAKFQLIMSKHVREKCGKLSISSILSSKRGWLLQKLTQVDNTRTWSVVQ